MKHPIQKVAEDEHGVVRFVANDIVRFMVDKLKEFGFDLNDLHAACHKMDKDDWDQFNQLIGYSLSGIPLNNEQIHTIASNSYDNGEDPNTNSGEHYEKLYKQLKKDLQPIIADLYEIHPDDLD